jgi:hypothetical protein
MAKLSINNLEEKLMSKKMFTEIANRFSFQKSIGKLTVNISDDGVCYRWRGRGWSLDRSPLTFSERNGYREFRRLPFGWRVKPLINIEVVPCGRPESK